MKQISMRHKKKNTNLFFDSFKHFKHNLSNLIGVELPTLCHLGAEKYLKLISANYKSKYPDMRKIGLINYDKPSDYNFSLSIEAEEIKKTLDKNILYNENALKNGRKNIDSLSPKNLLSSILRFDKYREKYRENTLQLILSYYDSADSIRPYLVLLNCIRKFGIAKLSKDVLQDILAHTKEDILLMRYNENAFRNLDFNTQKELNRPIPYIYNFLQTSLVIDDSYKIIVDFNLVDKLNATMSEIVLHHFAKNNSRPAKEQRIFRSNVLKAYEYKCAITGKSLFIDDRCLLEAAHIIPFSDSGSFAVSNGIALSYEMHKLFDNGAFSFEYENDDKIVVIISQSNRINDSCGILSKLNRKAIFLPKEIALRPDPLALQYNQDKIFIN